MSYDLTLRPRRRALTEDAFVELFGGRPNYRFPDDDASVASYFNPATEVSFYFRWTAPGADEPRGALVFVINLFRPPTWAVESESELAAITEILDLAVEDPQAEGISGDAYDGDQFLAGWDHGNGAAYDAVLADPGGELPPFHLPYAQLRGIWQWNFQHEEIAELNGGFYVAPLVGYARHATTGLVTVIEVDLARGFLLPRVDWIRLLRGKTSAFVGWAEIEAALALADGDSISEPWPYWAVVRSEAERLDRLLARKRAVEPIDSVPLVEVHASEDVGDVTTETT